MKNTYELQGVLDGLNINFKEASAKVEMFKYSIKELEEKALKDGYILKNGEFIKDEYVWLYVYADAYFDKYVGEKGAMYNASCGSKIITEEKYKEFRDKFEDKHDYIPFSHEYGCYDSEIFDTTQIFEDGSVKFVYDGSDGLEDATPGSGFILQRVKESEATIIKSKNWSFVDEMKFEYNDSWKKANELIKKLK